MTEPHTAVPEEPVRLVLRGEAAGAPVCAGDVCQLPGVPEQSTVDFLGLAGQGGDGPGWPSDRTVG